ncbi:MAG: hypothetical protein H8E34_05300 [Bacteroidetes bacterium]|nr:hypothetical protein [Bacteroidota bacterium]MBL6943368.1 hypothetical protein [Bacteroidales bacterium]
MDSNNKHIDLLIREKFETFAPSPPDHVWTGIEKGMRKGSYFQFFKSQKFIIISVALLLALITSVLLFKPTWVETSESSPQQINNTEESSSSLLENQDNLLPDEDANKITLNNDNISSAAAIETNKEPSPDRQPSETNTISTSELILTQPVLANVNKSISIIEQNNQYRSGNYSSAVIELKQSVFVYPAIYANKYKPTTRNLMHPLPDDLKIDKKNNRSYSCWKTGYYLTPELSGSNYDSAEILNSYSLSIEPTYFFNKNWFVRFGAGLSLVRDRGTAKITYVTNEYMGSYNDVYDVTFDTVSGNIIPTYHTKVVEVWDSIRHIFVSGVTNRYIYLQIPALFGYYNQKQGSVISWYLLGGPVFNLKVGTWIDDPKPLEKNADIIDLQNNLPIRSNNYFQLFLGARIEYEINKKLSIAFEPGYRYYFSSIYCNPYNATSSSGFTLKVGLIYLMK